MLLPVSPAIAGIYVSIDKNQGVWKAPANVNIVMANRPEIIINDHEQQILNPDPANGKCINLIRSFPGRGSALVWGARTLAVGDNESKWVSVRRFLNMVEESIRISLEQFVFELNSINTWRKIKSMIENFLINLWRNGALAGSTADHAFFVKIGLGQTMTEADILEGNMIIELGLAVIRPAEFTIVSIKQKMLSET
jgi:phage tail sheath protein FI